MARPSKEITELRIKLFAEGSYFCQVCDRVRPLGDFGKDSNAKHGVRSMCKECTNKGNYGRIDKFKEANGMDAWRAKRREYMAAHREGPNSLKGKEHYTERLRDYRLKYHYGISQAEFNRMLANQDGRCAICMTPKPSKDWHLDHCHETGAVRGVLCNLCNGGLGFFQDNRDALLAAEIYLRPRGKI